ncbi:MAG: heavy-metal-associated domain-containing protein [Macromonas sp.]
MNDHIFTVTGMSCAHCERAIVQSIRALDPNATVHADRTTQQVRIQHTQHSAERLAAAITEEGYTVVSTQP